MITNDAVKEALRILVENMEGSYKNLVEKLTEAGYAWTEEECQTYSDSHVKGTFYNAFVTRNLGWMMWFVASAMHSPLGFAYVCEYRGDLRDLVKALNNN